MRYSRRPKTGIPLLFVEVLSPSTARFDRFTKRRRYQRSAVGEYWIIDTDARLIEPWTLSDDQPQVLDDRITWSPAGATEPLEIDLAEFFREIWRKT
ncbi:MAG: Uma2 family endonuclease [Gemmatimonadaceae bacterium]